MRNHNVKTICNMTWKYFLRGLKLLIISLLLNYAFMDEVLNPEISDKLIESIFYKGKTTRRLTYEDLKMRGHRNKEFEDSFKSLSLVEEMTNKNISEKENIRPPYSFVTIILDSNYEKESNKTFTKSNMNRINSLFSTKSKLILEASDLEYFVYSSILTYKESIMFFESLIEIQKTKFEKKLNDLNGNLNPEIYHLKLFPLKSLLCLFLVILLTAIIFRIAKLNFVMCFMCTIFSYCMSDFLYKNGYYNISSIFLGNIPFCFLQILYKFLRYYGINQEDYDVLHDNIKSTSQFTLKLIILLILSIIFGLFTFLKYRTFLNYLVFYFGIVKILVLTTSHLSTYASNIFQPLYNLILFFVGLFNFIFTNFHYKIKRFSKEGLNPDSNSLNNFDNFYLVSQGFSLFAFTHLQEFLFAHTSNISDFLIQKYTNVQNFSKNFEKLKLDYREQFKYFSLNDSMWLIVFSFGIIILITAIYNNQYSTFLLGLYYLQITLSIFNKVFKFNVVGTVFSFFIFFTLLMNEMMCNRLKENCVYLDLVKKIEFYTISISEETALSIVKFIGIFNIYLLFIFNIEYIYDESNEYESFKGEQQEVCLEPDPVFKTSNDSKELLVKFLFKTFDFLMSYLIIFFLLYLIVEVEKNKVIHGFYGILLCILFYRSHAIILSCTGEYFDFLLIYFGHLFACSRILVMSLFDELAYLFGGCYFLSLILLLIFKKGDYMFSMLIIFYSYIICNYLNSNCLFVYLSAFYFFFKFRDISEKYVSVTIIRWKITILIVWIVNFNNIHDFFYLMAKCNEPITNIITRDYYGIFNFAFSNKVINEFKVMNYILEVLGNLFGIKN